MNSADQISTLLAQACDAHHDTFKQTGGVDVDWALWYAKWLAENPKFTDAVGHNVAISKLVYALMALDIDYTEQKPDETWSDYYAQNFIKYLKKEVSN